MKAWMLSLADLVRPWGRRRPGARRVAPLQVRAGSTPTRTQRSWRAAPSSCEALEGRALLATSSVVPFATLAGQVTAANQNSEVVLHLNAGELQASQSPTVVVGFYVEATNGSAVDPKITRVTGPNGQITPVSIAPHGKTAADKLARQTHLFARVIPLSTQSQDITLNVGTLNKKTGSYIVEAYLAGDVTGDGTVDASDVAALQVAYGTHEGQANYNAAADFNGDGRVGCIDQTLTTLNLGTHVIVPTTTTAALAATAFNPYAAIPTPTEVDLAPSIPAATVATTTTPIAVATPVAIATPVAATSAYGTASYVPVTYSSAIPVASTSTYGTASYVPVAYATPATVPAATASTTPVVLTPVYSTTGTAAATTTATGTTATPVYLVTQPVATTTGASTAPVYLYGQPVVGGTSASTGATLFGQTGQTPATTSATPIPVYLYQ